MKVFYMTVQFILDIDEIKEIITYARYEDVGT